MSLTGVLHLIEGILTYLFGAIENEEILIYKEEKIAVGHTSYGRWFVPLLFFKLQGFYVPIFANIVYYNETFHYTSEEKAHLMGLSIGLFGCILVGVTVLVYYIKLPLIFGLILMSLLHEGLFKIDAYLERESF